MKTVSDLVNSLIRDEIRELGTYHVPDASGLIKLDAMENPHVWPADMREEWRAALAEVSPNRYPDPEAKQLVSTLRQRFQIPESLGVLLGNGSDELIQILLMAIAGPDRCVLSPEPGFVMYRQIARFLGLEYVGVPLNDDFSLSLDQMLSAIEQHQPSIIFIAFPNNPTANLFDVEALRRVIEAAPGLIVIDEAYEPFARQSFIASAGVPPKLLVMRTVSKLGLAGLRLGFLVGASELIEQLNKIRLPYNINVLTQMSVDFALKHYDVLQAQTKLICEQREQMIDVLNGMRELEVFPSDANFILFRVLSQPAADVFQALKGRGILIKNLAAQKGLLKNCLRVTIGTRSENEQFLAGLREIISASNH